MRARAIGICVAVGGLLAVTLGAAEPVSATTTPPAVPVAQPISTDTLPAYSPNAKYSIEHQTELETDTFSWGTTIVSAFQVGRDNPTYGAQAIGWATSTDRGVTWKSGILPGLTASSPVHPNATYPVVVNQSVAYSAKAATWLIPTVTYVASGTGFTEKALMVSRSTDGITWKDAITAVPTNVDKAWGVCDNTTTSPFYGNCYVAYSQLNSSGKLAFVTSKDGGLTWSAPVLTAASVTGYNTNPTVEPNGTLVVVATDYTLNGLNGSKLFSVVSTDGGKTFGALKPIATIQYHTPAGGVRALNKPSVDVDASGVVYAAWGDCRFEAACATNDIVYATSSDGVTWSAPIRVASDPIGSNVDHFIPGFAVKPGTSGSTAQLSVVYYTYKNATCTASTCLLDAAYTTSLNGGATWSSPYKLNTTSMPLAWLAAGNRGPMVGDYESVSFIGNRAIVVYPVATAPTNGTYHEGEYATRFPEFWTQ
jgi:hypothetical protein